MTLTLEATYADLAIGTVIANPDQPRKAFDPAALTELADSIRSNGLLQPIVVRPIENLVSLDGNAPAHMIIAGERRWRAAQEAGLTTIPCRILGGLDDDKSFVLSVMENVNRADMTVSEEAKAFRTLIGTGRSAAEVAKLFGKTVDYVTWRTAILALSDRHLALVDSGAITTTLAYYAAKLTPAGQQVIINKACRGEFRTDSEAVAFAQATAAQEQQGFFMEVQELVEQQQAQKAAADDGEPVESEFDTLLQTLDAVAARLAELVPDGAKPREIAAALGLDAPTLNDYVSDLADRAVATRRTLRKAAAIVAVAQAKAEAAA
jgi:ParB family chromosome partitioning protein